MKNILITDDNKNNRLTLQFILEDWQEEHTEEELTLHFAQNGKEAVALCEKTEFDIIFMDIMMPVMDGIEATTLIRNGKNKNTMIIACSALSDNEHKNKIITAGAEDYIVKPIDSDILLKRFNNYVSLVKNRKSKPYNLSAENVLNNMVYYRKVHFDIKNEVALSEFWEYFLLDSDYADREEFSDMIRLLYGLGSYQLKKGYKFNFFLEENDETIYLTMDNVVLLKPALVEGIIKRNYSHAVYKILGNKVSFAMDKYLSEESPHVVSATNQADEVIHDPTPVVESSVVASEDVKEVTIQTAEQELEVFDFIDEDDLHDVEEIVGELRSLINLIGSSEIDEHDILSLAQYIQKFGVVISIYSETYAISNALKTLAQDIIDHKERFQEKAKDINALCQAFNQDLAMWIEKLFHTGAPSIDFLDNSIISNANMITSFIKEPEAVGEEEVLDDIFDF